jgi:hypothetical protein
MLSVDALDEDLGDTLQLLHQILQAVKPLQKDLSGALLHLFVVQLHADSHCVSQPGGKRRIDAMCHRLLASFL